MSSTEMTNNTKPTVTEIQSVPDQELTGMDETILETTDVTLIETNKAVSRTLALIKPDAMQANNKNAILEKIKGSGFSIAQERELQLSPEKVALFYQEHEGKPFYNDLTHWMSSAPIYAVVLEKEDAVQCWRLLMGPTDSNKARDIAPSSIRALFGTDGSHNATHGSDSLESAEREINIIFSQEEEQVHVTEVQDLVDKFNTHDICKPDAVTDIEKAPEDIKSSDENKENEQEKSTVTAEKIADAKHLNTADLVTSQDQVTNLPDQDAEEHSTVASESRNTQDTIHSSSDQAATEAATVSKIAVITSDIVENEVSSTSVETQISKDISVEAEIKEETPIETEIKEETSIETGIKEETSIETEIKEEISIETEIKKETSIETEIKKDISVETEIKKDISIETDKVEKSEDTIVLVTEEKEISDNRAIPIVNEVEAVAVAVTVSAEVKSTIDQQETKEEKKEASDVNVKDTDFKKVELPVDQNEVTPVNNTAHIAESVNVEITVKSAEVDIKDDNVGSKDKIASVAEEEGVPIDASIMVDVEVAEKEDDIVVDVKAEESISSVEEKHTIISSEIIEKNESTTNDTIDIVEKEAVIDNADEKQKQGSVCEATNSNTIGSETSVTEETNSAPVVSLDVDATIALADESEIIDLALKANDDKKEDNVTFESAEKPNLDTPEEDEVVEMEEKAGLDVKEKVENNNENSNDVVDEKTNKQAEEAPKLEVSDPVHAPESVLVTTLNEEKENEESELKKEVKENIVDDTQIKVDLVEQDEADTETDDDDKEKVDASVASTTPADSLSSSSLISEESVSRAEGSDDSKENDDHITLSSTSSVEEDSSPQSSENSSVTKVGVLEDQVKEKKIKETNKDSAAVNDKKKLKAPVASGLRTSSVADKKKTVASTKTKAASSTVVKKRVSSKAEDASKSEEKPKTTATKAARVPRVALLATQPAKKKATTDASTSSTEEKPKKATSARSLVSRLTAPTAASARKKTSSADTTTAATATSTVRPKKPADPNQKKSSPTPPVKKVPASTIGSRATTTKPANHSELKSTTTRPPTTARRTSPPTSTATATKKTTVAPVKRGSKATVATGTRVAASGLTSTQAKTRKETSSIAAVKKAPTATVTHKKPVTSPKKKDNATPPNEKVDIKECTVKSEEDHPADVLDEQKEIRHPADEINSTIVTEENDSDSHAEEEEKHEEEKSTIEEVTIVTEEIHVSTEQEIIITDNQVSQEESTVEIAEEEAKVIINEPELQVEAESEVVNQPKQVEHQTIINATSDAEVAAITQTNITNNKPQMASLRSRFENLNNNVSVVNQLHTTPSKEIRSKSPNKISDMINRFTTN